MASPSVRQCYLENLPVLLHQEGEPTVDKTDPSWRLKPWRSRFRE